MMIKSTHQTRVLKNESHIVLPSLIAKYLLSGSTSLIAVLSTFLNFHFGSFHFSSIGQASNRKFYQRITKPAKRPTGTQQVLACPKSLKYPELETSFEINNYISSSTMPRRLCLRVFHSFPRVVVSLNAQRIAGISQLTLDTSFSRWYHST